MGKGFKGADRLITEKTPKSGMAFREVDWMIGRR